MDMTIVFPLLLPILLKITLCGSQATHLKALIQFFHILNFISFQLLGSQDFWVCQHFFQLVYLYEMYVKDSLVWLVISNEILIHR